jgi:putative membrane protein
MSRKALMSLVTMVMLATFVFASQTQQTDKPSSQTPAASSATQNPSSTALNTDDRKFMMDAAHGGMLEVHLGHMAVEKATNAEVKQFAQRMIDDHSRANSELMALASQKGVTLPASSDSAMMNQNNTSSSTASTTTPPTDQKSSTTSPTTQPSSTDMSASGQRHARVDAETGMSLDDQKEMNKLSGLSGDAFDREYINLMVKDHESAVKDFEKASTKAKDPDVRAFATKTLPTLREHLQQVRDIQSHLKSSGKTTGTK